jgi:hypothetical protein
MAAWASTISWAAAAEAAEAVAETVEYTRHVEMGQTDGSRKVRTPH